MKILDILYLTKILVTSADISTEGGKVSFKADVIVKDGHSFTWVKDLSVTGSAHFPWKASIEGPVANMTGFHTFVVHCSYEPVVSITAEEVELKVVIPIDWLTEKGYTDIRINYDKCMKLEEYAQYTDQAKEEEEEVLPESLNWEKAEETFRGVDLSELKSTLEALINSLSKMDK